jgi:hypothetical protein
MFFWFAASPLWWLLGLPGGGVFIPFVFQLPATLTSAVAMLVVLAGVGLLSRRALDY